MNTKKLVGGKVLNVAGIIGCILILPVLIIMMTMMIQRCFEPHMPPNFMGYTPLAVSSGSMSPVFDVNDMIIVDANSVESVADGDIISYWSGDVLITHRIIATEVSELGELVYVTQGDANNAPDSVRVTTDQIYGLYVGHIPLLGGLSLFLVSQTGIITCVIIMCLLAVCCLCVYFHKKYRALQVKLNAQSSANLSVKKTDC